MILRRLSLKNYRKYRALEIEFPMGLIGVVGRNGMGKTTLLEAVAFVLYGTDASRTKAKGVRREDARSDEACEVDLDFSVGGEPYRVVRRLRGTNETQQAELYRGGNKTPIATQPTGVTVAIRKRLAMDYSTFTRSVYSKQKEVNALSDASPGERQKAIRRMVGIETITRARNAAKDKRKEKELEVKGARTAIEALPSKKDETKKIREKLNPALSIARKADRDAVTAAKVAKAAKAKWEMLEGKRTAHEKLTNDLSSYSSQLRSAEKREEQLQDEMLSLDEKKTDLAKLLPEDRKFRPVRQEKERLDQAKGSYKERTRLVREVEDSHRDVATAKRKLASAQKASLEFRKIPQEKKVARSEEQKAKDELARLERARRKLDRPLESARSQKEKAEEALRKIQKLGPSSRCPTCYRQLGDSFEKIAAHLKAERDQYAGDFATAMKTAEAIEGSIRKAERAVQEAEQRVRAATDAGEDAATASERLTNAIRNHDRAKKTLREKQTLLNALLRVNYDEGRHKRLAEEYKRLAAIHDRVEALREGVSRTSKMRLDQKTNAHEIRSLRARLVKVKRQQIALHFDSGLYRSAMQTYDDAQENKTKAAEARSDARGEVKTLQEALKRTQDEVSRLEKLQERITDDEETIRYLERIEALLDNFRLELINRVRPQIEEYASMLFDQVTDGRYPRIVLDEDYNISIQDGSGAYPIRRFSGGEEDLANLCLRLAISQVVAHCAGSDTSSLVVLDEIFGSQDAERRERILQALVRLQETFQQIVLITHMEDIHDRVPNVLRITENATCEAQASWL